MKRINTFVTFVVSAVLAVVLSSCGGGSSSSGGAGSKAATPFAGQYAGIENLTITGPGGSFPIGPLPLSVSIDANGGVVVTDIDGIPFVGQLGNPANGLLPNQFIATAYVFIPTPPGLVCLPGTFGYIGNIVGNDIFGNASGSFTCMGNGLTAALVVGGPFSATRSAGAAPGLPPAASQPPGGGVDARKSRKQKLILDGVGSVL